jgi:hypothetical protein
MYSLDILSWLKQLLRTGSIVRVQIHRIIICPKLYNNYIQNCTKLKICNNIYSERQKYGINSLKLKQKFFQKNL